MFVDKTNIFVKAGDGGHGAATFRREKYVAYGGPDGGDGGLGGSIIFRADPNINTLVDYRFKRKYKAQNGVNGSKKNRHGKRGENLVLHVPVGTIVKDATTGHLLADLSYDNQEHVIVKGGRGGRGNARFVSSTRQAPTIAERGEPGVELEVTLELKLLADVGLVGFPNVGKSTFLSKVTKAEPKIGDYHFTTIHPNLGVARVKDKSFVVADIPGLIEGAHQGAGMGIQFLRHIERTRMLLHVVDISGSEDRDPYEDFLAINNELKLYNEKLLDLYQVVVANKVDLLEDYDKKVEDFKAKIGSKYEVFPLSTATKHGLDHIMNHIASKLDNIPKIEIFKAEDFKVYEVDNEAEFTIEKENEIYVVKGKNIEKLVVMTNFDNHDSILRFQQIFKKSGIEAALREKGIKEGDTVKILDMEFDFQ